MLTFEDYTQVKQKYITTLGTEFYPDTLNEAKILYEPLFYQFKRIAYSSINSIQLLSSINKIAGNRRVQLMRIFRKYVSPNTSVEMLKRKSKIKVAIDGFSSEFRDINKVREMIVQSPTPNLPLYALLYEYKDRGKKGYDLTEQFFNWMSNYLPEYKVEGQKRAGQDIILSDRLPDFQYNDPVDFLILDKSESIKAVGYARYDSDRGGAQEDDRIDGNRDKVTHLKEYNKRHKSKIKCVFINDGPGLLLGTMWQDYVELEKMNSDSVMVLTLLMLNERLTSDWIEKKVVD